MLLLYIFFHTITYYFQVLYPWLLHSARGIGTYCAISSNTTEMRDKIVHAMRQKG